MSSLVSLTLLGIRSFGPSEEDVGIIKFLSPITLILGQNGCGKTTIIESLKFATCGDLPENTNQGKFFVHDPNLTDNVETKAFVKLKFKDINGDSRVLTRPIQVTQKQKKLEFKRLESAIRFIEQNGDSSCLSSRCYDINNLITSSLGVSKAILTNVIFCHQEDSCWPLDEGKKVKEKFDAIFDAKKYNTCLENIRKIRLDIKTGLKVMKTELQFLTERKSEASSKRAQLSDTESKKSASQDLVKSLKHKLMPLTTRLQEIAEREDKIGKLQSEYGAYETRLSSIQEMIKDFNSRIECLFPGSDEELKEAVDNFQEEFSKKQEALQNFEKEIAQTDLEIKSNKDREKVEDNKLNALNRDNDRYTEKVRDRNKILLDICDDFQLKNTSDSLMSGDSCDMSQIFKSIQDEITDKQNDVADMKDEHESIMQQMQDEVNSLREEKVKTESKVDHKKQLIINVQKECDKLKINIEEVDKSAESLSLLESKFKKITSELNELNSNHDVNKMDSAMREMRIGKDKMVTELDAVEKEVQSMQKLSGVKAEIDVKKRSKTSKEEEIKKLLRRHSESLTQLLGEVPEEGIKLKFQSASCKLSEEIKAKNEEIKITEREITKLESEKRHLLEKLREARQSVTSDECIIEQECGNKNYDTYLTELSNKLQELQDQKGSLSSSEVMYKKYVQLLKTQDPGCPLCHRDFQNEEDVNSLILDLNLKMRELPSKLRTSKKQLEESQEKYNKLLQLKPKFDKLSNMKSVELPALQSDLERIDLKLDKALKRLNELQDEILEPLNNEELAKNIQGDVVILEQHWMEVRKISKEIQNLESKIPDGTQRCSLEDALEEQEILRSKLSSARSTLEKMQSKLNSVSRTRQQLQQDINSIQDQKMKISGKAQMRSQLIEKLNENEGIITTTQKEIDESLDQLSTISSNLEKSSNHLKSQQVFNTKTLQENISKLKLIEQKFKEVTKVQKDITDFEISHIPEKIKSTQINISVLRESNESLNVKKETMNTEKEKLKTHLASQKSYERDLEDNMKLRTKLVEEKELNEKIKSLKLILGSTDYVSITMEKNKLRQEEERVNRERAQAEGRLKELENTVFRMKEELNKDSYKNADKLYRDKFIQIKVEESSIDDLNKFYISLDWALTHFHQEKMKAINSTIRDLWREIYQGNDIDSIQIKADVDSSVNADKRRTYNYRVVQKKNNVEMEMRGRCSAGQKVLASLIIRMALAETFSANCGVLALDEPTTNLDEANIHSLSEALVRIVSRRCVQKNFQLIIISHDKTFLDVLQRIDKAQYYYKVSRNMEGRSRIEKVHVHNSMEMDE